MKTLRIRADRLPDPWVIDDELRRQMPDPAPMLELPLSAPGREIEPETRAPDRSGTVIIIDL